MSDAALQTIESLWQVMDECFRGEDELQVKFCT
jgi:hypothetical protein